MRFYDFFLVPQVSGKTPLHVACERHDFDIVQMLVEKGAEVSGVDGAGLSVLHHHGNLEAASIVMYLLHNGLSVDIKHEVLDQHLGVQELIGRRKSFG